MRNPRYTEKLVRDLTSKKSDILVRTISYMGGTAYICYIGQLADRQAISNMVVKPLQDYCKEGKKNITAAYAANNLLFADQCLLDDDPDQIEPYILNGQTVVLFSTDRQYVAVGLKKVEKRTVAAPELMYSLRGPRDAFVEDIDTNLSLVRHRLKDDSLRIEKKQVGVRTKSTVAVLYIEDIANTRVVKEISRGIDAIQTDGIYESGELQAFLQQPPNSLFPRMGIVERSDLAVEELLEGKVLVLVDGSNTALRGPMVFTEFLFACDDRYDNKFFGLFMRLIRYAAVFLSITLTSFYIALAEYHQDVMAASYIVTFAQMRARTPFPAFVAVLSLEFIVELMREALLRVPVKIGSAIAIVGAIIIGQAASTSGVYTPLLLILVSIAFLATFAIPDITLAHPLRILKFLVIIMTGFMGFYGFALAITLILSSVVSIDNFGVPYMAPWAPFNFYDFVRTLLFSKRMSPKRQQYMRDKDDTRSPE
ncbi:MAG: spore germination protein [Clostridiaceae bacterium]|nr:spore germination protein [Eubacteriales bacterium]